MSNFPQDGAAHMPSAADKADALYQNYLAGGPDAAYASLRKDYDASAGMCNRDQYFQEVAADLQASGHMPNIAVGWLRAEKGEIAGADGVINKQDVLNAEKHGGLDAIFGKVVLTSVPSPGDNKTFFDQLAHTKKAWTDSPDGIEDADLRKYERQMHRAERHVYNQQETAKAADPLFANNGELLAALDTGPHGERNGFISRHEMKNFLKEYKEHPDQGVYTAANAEYVNELLHGDVARVSNHPFHGFSVDRLERRAGGPPVTADAPSPVPDKPCADAPPAKKEGSACDVPAPPPTKPEVPAKAPDVCLDEEVRKTVDLLSRVQPNEGYNAVAARLLDIHPGHVRTPEEVKQIKTLGLEISKMNGDYSTLRLRTGVVLPVSANLELLMNENPALKASIEKMKANLSKPPAVETTSDIDGIPGC